MVEQKHIHNIRIYNNMCQCSKTLTMIAWQDPELVPLQVVLEAYGAHFIGVDSRLELVQGQSPELAPGQAVAHRPAVVTDTLHDLR